jgi:hypothetical protein
MTAFILQQVLHSFSQKSNVPVIKRYAGYVAPPPPTKKAQHTHFILASNFNIFEATESFLTFICLRRSYISYDLVHRIFTAQVRDVTPWPLTVTDTCDAVRKQKKAEYNKQYRLKCKLLLQASTSTETELAEKQKKAQYDQKK